MDGRTLADGSKVPYSSLGEAVKVCYSEAGVKSFYKGFSSNCQRLVSWNIVMFVIREQVLEHFKKNQN